MQMENQRALVVGSRARKANSDLEPGSQGRVFCQRAYYCGRECRVGMHLVSVGHSHSSGWEGKHG